MTADELDRLKVLATEARGARQRLDRRLAKLPDTEATRQPLAALRFALVEIEQIVLER